MLKSAGQVTSASTICSSVARSTPVGGEVSTVSGSSGFTRGSGAALACVSSNARVSRARKSSSAASGLGEREVAAVHQRLGVELAHAAVRAISSYIFGWVNAGSSASLWPKRR